MAADVVTGWRVAGGGHSHISSKGNVVLSDVRLLKEILVLFCTSGFQQTRKIMH